MSVHKRMLLLNVKACRLIGVGLSLGPLISSVGLIQYFHACGWGDLASKFIGLVLGLVLSLGLLA